jgi:hypothetical protein
MPAVTWDALYNEDATCPECGSEELHFRTLREHREWYTRGQFQAIDTVTERPEVVVLAVDCATCEAEILNRYNEGLAAIRQALDGLKGKDTP